MITVIDWPLYILIHQNSPGVIIKTMKWLLSLALLAVVPASAQSLADVKTVYLLPMSRGMDQFLAERLTSQHVLQVVTDPQRADVVLSDRIGAAFQQSLEELYAPKHTEAEKQGDGEYTRPVMQPLSRGKGNVFLVDRKTSQVLWSAFINFKNSDPKSLNDAADDIAGKLAKALSSANKK